jgi:hypothetical protein
MATRPKNPPQYAHDTGTISGLEPWGWEDYGAGGDWWEGTGINPSSVPEEIQGEWGDYSLGYGPEGTGEGLGPNAIMPFNWEDRETALAGTEGGLGSLFGEGSDYGLNFNPTETANRSWRPTYDVMGPEGDTGYHIGAKTPHTGYPWVPGGYEGNFGGGGGGGNEEKERCELSGGTWDGYNCHPKVDIKNPTLGGTGNGTAEVGALSGYNQYPGSEILDALGNIQIDPESAPLYPAEFQNLFTTEVANDPLSRKANLALENLISTGGVVSTPFTSQAEQKLSEILDLEGDTAPTEGEATIFQNLSDVVSGHGEAPPTTLEAEHRQLLNELISSGGELPQDDQRLAMQIEAARSPLDILRRSQLEQGQSAMADRGLLGQGPEADYMERLEGRLAPMYTQAAQQIAIEEGERSDERYNLALQQLNQQATTQRLSTDQRFAQARSLQTDMALDRARRQDSRLQNAIQQASNLTIEQSRNLVDSVNALSGVQQMRQDAAVEMLEKNMEWNKFLAEYGLERDKTMAAIQQGRYEALLPLIQEYFKVVALAGEGYVSGTSEQSGRQ